MVSSNQRRISKGCLVLVEGTWFDELGTLLELSGTVRTSRSGLAARRGLVHDFSTSEDGLGIQM